MKLSITLLAIASVGQTNARGLRKLQTCPVPPANVPCTANYDPMTCGESNCEYDNDCLASNAGFNVANDCIRVNQPTCPLPMQGACTANIAPVQCGDYNCEYDNACLANLAGFADTQCIEVIPAATPAQPQQGAVPANPIECPVGEGMCTMEYNPVMCGACEYSNPCGAELAGFNPTTDCVSAFAEEQQCPEMAPGICTADYNPVKCGQLECEYSNLCGAELAGFNPQDCTPSNQPEPQPATGAVPTNAIECPAGEGMCTMEYNPVKCGACEYSNPCGAELAGFNPATDCVSAIAEQQQCPEMAQGICTADYNPVKCGELQCEYSNLCGAELAGFSAADCTSANQPVPEQYEAATPTNPIECPVGEGMCTYEYDPVKCGACEYSNPCAAELAGFNPTSDCVSTVAQCPEMKPGMCTMEYLPVKCGELECEYSNLCGAELAGFSAADCTSATATEVAREQQPATPTNPIECPVGEGLCTADYNPVKCGACEYSNLCAAELAGFAAADCVSVAGGESAATQVFTSTTYEDPSNLDENEDNSSAVALGVTGSLVAIVAFVMA